MAAVKVGQLYHAIHVPIGEYLTVGETYTADMVGRNVIGLHRPTDGSGTYVQSKRVRIVLPGDIRGLGLAYRAFVLLTPANGKVD